MRSSWYKHVARSVWNFIPQRLQWRLLWLTQPKFNVGVTGLIWNPQGQVLLLHHVMRGSYPWGLPSGWVHSGERVEAALKREVIEETSIEISVDSMLCVVSGLQLRLEVVFLCSTQASEANRVSAEVFQAAFFAPEALPDGILPSHARYIEQVVNAKTVTTIGE